MPRNDRFVVKHASDWAVKKAGVTTPESVHPKQSGAERWAKHTIHNRGVWIQGGDGRWRDSDCPASLLGPN